MRTARRDGAIFVDLCAQLLGEGRSVRFRAEGTSMLPTILDGDLITVGPVERDSIRSGDIILFHQHRRPIVHRVTEIRRTGDGGYLVVARGDGKAADDAPIEPRQILGRIVAIERRADSRLMRVRRAASVRLRRAVRSASCRLREKIS